MKTILIAIGIGVVAYNSVYFKNLDEYKLSKIAKEFDAAAYAKTFWDTKLVPNMDSAVELSMLIEQLKKEPEKAFDQHSHALGIGNLSYFLVKGSGPAASVEGDYVELSSSVRIATEFIFGNAVRDASGQINVNEFVNTMDFNNVSAEINKIIREKVLPPFKRAIKEGNTVEFTGAIELNKEHLNLSQIEVIPIRLNIVDAGN